MLQTRGTVVDQKEERNMDHSPTFKLGIAEAAFPDLPDLRGAGVDASLGTIVVFRIGEADAACSLALLERFA